jgi:dienelactone hydrolase
MKRPGPPAGVVAVTRALALDTGGQVDVTWWVPTRSVPLGVAWVQHGYARNPLYLSSLAVALADAGLLVALPALASFRRTGSLNDGPYLDAIGRAVAGLNRRGSALHAAVADAGAPALSPDSVRVVLVGHSAGGAVVARAARSADRTVGSDSAIAGLVVLDATENLAKTFASSLPDLTHEPILGVFAAPSRCNLRGAGADALRSEHDGFVGIRLTTGNHCDAEGPDTDRVCRTLCGRPDPVNIDLLFEATVTWVRDLATGEIDPAWRPGGTRLNAETAAERVRIL